MNNGQALADFLSVSTTYYGWSDLEEHLRQFWSMEFDDRPFKNNASKVTDLLKRIGLVERRGPHLFTDAYTFADLISKVEDDEDILFLNQPVDLSRPMKASLLQKQAYGEYFDHFIPMPELGKGGIKLSINLIHHQDKWEVRLSFLTPPEWSVEILIRKTLILPATLKSGDARREALRLAQEADLHEWALEYLRELPPTDKKNVLNGYKSNDRLMDIDEAFLTALYHNLPQPKTSSAQTIGDKVSEFIKAHSGNSVTYNEWKTFCKDVAGDRADQLHRLIMKMDLAWEGPDYGTLEFQWWDPNSPLVTKVTDVFEEEAEHDKVNYTPEKEEEAIILLTSPAKQGSRKVAAIAGYINMVFLGKTLRDVRVGAVGNTIWYHIPVMDLMGITVDIDGGWYNIQTPQVEVNQLVRWEDLERLAIENAPRVEIEFLNMIRELPEKFRNILKQGCIDSGTLFELDDRILLALQGK